MDAVVIAVPDHWHTPILLEALAAGKDAFLEKPMTFRMEEGHAIVKAVRAGRRVVQIGTQQKSGPHFIEAKQRFFDSHLIGKVSLVRTWWIARRTRHTRSKSDECSSFGSPTLSSSRSSTLLTACWMIALEPPPGDSGSPRIRWFRRKA